MILHNKNNNNKIIREDDIILSDSKTLSERFSSQQSEIDNLKSNVKWLYKYGGVGSGTGGGGASSTNFSVTATLNNIQLNGQNIILPNSDTYNLYIKINKPLSRQFNVKVTYTQDSSGNNVSRTDSYIFKVDNNWEQTIPIRLNNNGHLTILATDGDDTKTAECNYITNPYYFTTSIKNNREEDLPNEIFITDAAKNGIVVNFNYSIYINANVSYVFKFNGKEQSGELTEKTGTIKFDIDKDLFNESKSGLYNGSIDINIQPENQEPIKQTLNFSFSLIPENLYVLFYPESGQIYSEEQTENYYQYNPQSINFNYRIYQGVNSNRSYTVNIHVNDNKGNPKSILERSLENIQLFVNEPGWNTVTILVYGGGQTYNKTYYLYVKSIDQTINWFKPNQNWVQNYYRINDVTNCFNEYKGLNYIEQTVNSDQLNIKNIEIPEISGGSIVNTLFSISLQYNNINNSDNFILKLKDDNNQDVVQLDQNKITYRGTSNDNIYIEKQSDYDLTKSENYHLITIYSNYIKTIVNQPQYEINVYIDGILEATFSSLSNSAMVISSIVINNINCAINLIDIDYLQSNITNDIHDCDYESYQFYLTYLQKIQFINIFDKIQEFNNISNFKIDRDTGRIETKLTDISNIAQNHKVLLVRHELTNSETLASFLSQIEQSYDENDEFRFQVDLSYSNGSGLKLVQLPSEMQSGQWYFDIQGSSTKGYRNKNWELSLINNDDSEQAGVFLFSPNYDKDNSSTFLPEQSFNLKADVVDSSHSNNTACGKFVNTVCTKFNTNTTGYHKNYVKNCLDGFSTLLFLHIVYEDKGLQINKYFYLGIVNFNLNRKSYFNLGYNDISVFGTEKSILSNANPFTFINITKEQNKIKDGLRVAEIQGGNPHFDFSQYDKTILFQQVESDKLYMFGDIINSGQLDDAQKDIINFVKQVTLGGGYCFNGIRKKFGPYEDGYNGDIDGVSKNQVPDYTSQYKREANNLNEFVLKEKIPKATETDLRDLVISDEDLDKVKILNFDSLSEYYTICMVLGLIDSVQKNLNIKTWSKNNNWYIAFYDMDTCLGVSNSGGDVSPICFSDYWESKKSTNDSIDTYTNTVIYRDYWPKDAESQGIAGYDIPSSYLFAICKYAPIFLKDSSEVSNYPEELYAKWRNDTYNKNNNWGILKNADNFMDNFFVNNLKTINPLLISYNYRVKYLQLDGKTYQRDYSMFHGTRINKIHDWLNERLHILDVYFGLNKSVRYDIYYKNDNGDYVVVPDGDNGKLLQNQYKGNYQLLGNDDVIILHDIFNESNSNGIQFSQSFDLYFKSKPYSPLQICTPNMTIGNYITNTNNKIKIRVNVTGNQEVKFGGSKNWTWIKDINFLQTNSIYIKSELLEEIRGTGGSSNAKSFEFKTPALKILQLTNPNYNGDITLEKTTNYPNLNEVNFSNSSLSKIILNDLNITSLNISNIKNTYSEITISNCLQLEKFVYSKLDISKLSFTDCYIKELRFENTNLNTLEISSKNNSRIVINNIANLRRVTLNGFSEVIIKNCSKLQEVVLGPTIENGKLVYSLTKLTINNCNNQNLSVVDSTDNENINKISLKNSNKLTYVNFSNCQNIKQAELIDDLQLSSGCFNNTSLETLDGNLIINGNSIFKDCPKFTLKQSNGSYCNLRLSDNLTDINYLFGCQLSNTPNKSIDLKAVNYFIKNCVTKNNNITNINYLFYNCRGITFTENNFVNNSAIIDMTNFSKVNTAIGSFADTNIQCIDKRMWNFGATEINLSNFVYPYYRSNENNINDPNYLYVSIDSLENIINKVTSLELGSIANIYFKIVVYNKDKTEKPEIINLSEFFNPNGQSPTKLKRLSRWFVYCDQTLDLSNLFTSNWTDFQNLIYFCYNVKKYINYEGLFKQLPNITKIQSSLCWSDDQVEVDLFDFFNWQRFLSKKCSFSDGSDDSWMHPPFTFKKKIQYENLKTLCNYLTSSKIENISSLFSNCSVYNYDNTDFVFGNTDNNTIKYLRYLFYKCKFYTSDSNINDTYLSLSSDTFKHLNNITNVYAIFYNTKLSKIPFNLFNKRIIDTSYKTDVFVGDNEKKPAKLTMYTYNKNIESFSLAFDTCQFQQPYFNDDIPRNSVIDSDGNQYNEYYYKNIIKNDQDEDIITYTKYTLIQDTAVLDLDVKGFYSKTFDLSISGKTINLKNPNITAPVNNLCIPPDLFYSTDQNIYMKQNDYGKYYNIFRNSNIEGIIPKHIFLNDNSFSPKYAFYNCKIIPQLIDTINGIKVYSHFPENYTSADNLDYVFNCNFIYPSYEIQQENYIFIIMKNTISQYVRSLKYTFDNNQDFAGNFYVGQSLIEKNYINYIGEITSGEIKSGLDMSYFTNLKLDYIFYNNELLNRVITGLLFNEDFHADDVQKKLQLENSYVMSVKLINSLSTALSRNIKLPSAQKSINRLFLEKNITAKTDQFLDDTSRTVYQNNGFTIND